MKNLLKKLLAVSGLLCLSFAGVEVINNNQATKVNAATYTITFYDGAREGFFSSDVTGEAPSPMETNASGQVTFPGCGTLSIPGYTFSGWAYSLPNIWGASPVATEGQTKSLTANTIAYPVWTPKIKEQPSKDNDYTFVLDDDVNLNYLTPKWYVKDTSTEITESFGSWKLLNPISEQAVCKFTLVGGGQTDEAGVINTNTITSDKVVANEYNLYLNYKGDSTTVQKAYGLPGRKITLPNKLDECWSRVKYYSTEADGTGTTYNPLEEYNVDDLTDTTLYANWIEDHICDFENCDRIIDSSFTGGTLEEGNYYLTANITLTENIIIEAGSIVGICLNGYVLNLNTYVIDNKGKLGVYDCGYTVSRYFNDENEDKIYNVWSDTETTGSIKVVGGVITGGQIINEGDSEDDDLTICGVVFIGNVNDYGGAIVCKSADMYCYISDFIYNSAERGGAIYAKGEGEIRISKCIFNNNEAKYINGDPKGGAICAMETSGNGISLKLEDCTFSENKATDEYAKGGAIYALDKVSCILYDSTIQNNEATEFGGMFVSTSAGTKIVFGGNTIIKNNSASGEVSNLYVKGCSGEVMFGNRTNGADAPKAEMKIGVQFNDNGINNAAMSIKGYKTAYKGYVFAEKATQYVVYDETNEQVSIASRSITQPAFGSSTFDFYSEDTDTCTYQWYKVKPVSLEDVTLSGDNNTLTEGKTAIPQQDGDRYKVSLKVNGKYNRVSFTYNGPSNSISANDFSVYGDLYTKTLSGSGSTRTFTVYLTSDQYHLKSVCFYNDNCESIELNGETAAKLGNNNVNYGSMYYCVASFTANGESYQLKSDPTFVFTIINEPTASNNYTISTNMNSGICVTYQWYYYESNPDESVALTEETAKSLGKAKRTGYYYCEVTYINDTVVTSTSYIEGPKYSVTYINYGDVVGSVDSNTYFEDEKFTVKSEIPTRTGYTFTGWKYGLNTYHADDQVAMGGSNAILYGTWKHTCNSMDFENELNQENISDYLLGGNYYLSSGSYFLSSDITLQEDTEFVIGSLYTINLCLNGYVLDLNKNHIIIALYSTLNIYDCSNTTRYFTDKKNLVYDTANNTYTIVDGQDGCYESYSSTYSEGSIQTIGGVITGGWGNCAEQLSTSNGGAIEIGNNGTLVLNGGVIIGNIANKGIVYNNSTFTMNGGAIMGNRIYGFKADEGYGAVYNEGTVTINKGEIMYNKAYRGGGVYNKGVLTMNNGHIMYNEATFGAGIHRGEIYLYGGEISHNKTTGSGTLHTNYGGAGVLFEPQDKLVVGGDIIIQNNYSNGVLDNVSITGEQDKAQIEASTEKTLKENARIGIRMKSGAEMFVAAYPDDSILNNFTSDDDRYGIVVYQNACSCDYATVREYKIKYRTITSANQIETKAFDTAVYKVNAKITITSEVVEREGYTFGGWRIGNTIYKANDKYTVLEGDNIVADAVWVHKCHELSFDYDLFEFTGGYLTSGNYFLSKDIKLTSAIRIEGETVNLCLNGYVLDLNGYNIITDTATLNIYDCGETVRYFTDKVKVTFDSTLDKYNEEQGHDGCYETYSSEYSADAVMVVGGVITGGKGNNEGFPKQRRGGAIENQYSTLVLNGGTIIGNYSNKGTIANIYQNTKFVMNGGYIMYNSTANLGDGYGGAIYNDGSIVEINGGEISYNKATYGGAIYTTNSGTVTIKGGRLCNNYATNQGGGICNEFSEITISGGQFIGNEAEIGGFLYTHYGKFTFNEDSELDYQPYIAQSKAIRNGTGVDATGGQGGAIYNNCTLITIDGGEISYNFAYEGGAIYNFEGTITINNCLMTYNGADCADAIYNYKYGKLIMNGGTISYNGGNPYGVIYAEGETYLYGGEITHNYAVASSNVVGAAIFVVGKKTFEVGGAIVIKDNHTNGKVDNVLLEKDALITISTTKPFKSGACVSINMVDGTGVFVSGSIDPKDTIYFVSDSSLKTIIPKETGEDTFKYSLEEAYTIKYDLNGATGSKVDNNVYTANRNVVFEDNSGTNKTNYKFLGWALTKNAASNLNKYTINGSDADENHIITLYAVWKEVTFNLDPQYVTYDGTAKTYVVAIVSDNIGGFTVTYSVTNPTNAGTYDVTFTRAASGIYSSISKTVTGGLVINKASVNEPTVTNGNFQFDNTMKNVDISGVEAYMTLSDDSQITGTNVGQYQVKYTLDANHAWAEGSDGILTWSINKGQAEITLEQAEYEFTYGEVIALIEPSTNFGTIESSELPSASTNAGTYYITYTINETSNYLGDSKTAKVVINKASVNEPTIAVNSFVYDGNEKEIAVGLSQGVIANENNVLKATNAGTYTLNFSVDNNHKWAEGSDGIVTWEITKATPVITMDSSDITKAYGEELVLPEATSNFGTVTCDKVVSDLVNVGTYYVNYKVEESNNYYGVGLSVKVVITKGQATISVDQTDIVKTFGEELVLPEATSNFGTVTCDKVVSDLVNAGTYYVNYSVESTDNYKGDTKQVKVVINKATSSEPSISVDNFVYDGTEKLVTIDGVKSYMTADETNVTKATNVGTYIIIYTLDANHEWAEGVDGILTWSITKGQAEINVDQTDIVVNYGQSISLPTATSNYGNVVCDTDANSLVNAGTYYVNYTVEETNNYFGDTKQVKVVINKATVNEPTIEKDVFVANEEEKQVNLSGVESYMSATESSVFKATQPGIYTIVYTLDANHTWAEGSDGVIVWKINNAEVQPKTENPEEKPAAMVEIEGGFDPSITVEVEVTVEAEVETAQLTVDYSNIISDNEEVKLKDNEVVGIIFDVKLYQTNENGEKVEIQPSDIAEGTTIKVKMLIPEDIDVTKITKIIHVHSETDIQVYEFDISKLDENRYYEIEIDRLSEFAFIYKTNQQAGNPIVPLAIAGSAIIMCAVVIFLYRRKKAKKA